jgi:hypothetical protein
MLYFFQKYGAKKPIVVNRQLKFVNAELKFSTKEKRPETGALLN